MSELSKEYSVAATAVMKRLEEQKPAYFEALKTATKNDVVVYAGVHDHVQNILKELGLTYSSSINRSSKILFVNCGHRESYPQVLSDAVKAGLHCVTSDWALDVVTSVFPGMVRKLAQATGDEVISVEASSDSLWNDVVIPGANPQWWLEGSSYPFEITNDNVRVEAASHELMTKYKSPHVAVSFPWGEGSVFHVISHFWCKRTQSEVAKHQTDAIDFLREGMKLSENSISSLANNVKGMRFGPLQTAATSTELIAQLIARTLCEETNTTSSNI